MITAPLLALTTLVLGGLPPPPGLPPVDPFGPVLTALEDGRWDDALPALQKAWADHRHWVEGWTKRYDALRFEACGAVPARGGIM